MEYIPFDAHQHYTLASVARPDGQLVREQRIPIANGLDGHRGASLTSHEKLLERPALVRDAYHISLRAPVSPSSSVVRRRDKGPA